MSQYDQLVRLKEFELDERRRDAGKILEEVNRLTDQKKTLEENLIKEQEIAANSREWLADYGAFASRIKKEREALETSIVEVEKAYSQANGLVSTAYQEVRKAEIVRDEALQKEKENQRRNEQMVSDEVSQNIYRRKPKRP